MMCTPGVPIVLTLKNLTIRDAFRQGNQRDSNGAAVYATNNIQEYFNLDRRPTLVVDNVTFTNNVSVQTNTSVAGYDYGGGAIMVWGTNLIVRNSRFFNHRSEGGGGGGIHVLDGRLTLDNTLFRGNVTTTSSSTNLNSGWGGAFYVDNGGHTGGRVIIKNTTFENNLAGARGGVAYIDLYLHLNQSMTIEGSRFIGNRVENPRFASAGAIVTNGININQGGRVDVSIKNSLFQNNVSRGEGNGNGNRGGEAGALRLSGQYTTIANTTFIGNRAEGECSNCWNASGGAMFVANTPGPVRIMNSVFANNYSGWGAAGINAGGGNVIVDNSIFYNNIAFRLGRTNNDAAPWHCRETMQGGSNNIQFPVNDDGPACRPNVMTVNPLLGDLQGLGLTLRPNSPAIDAGNNAICAAAPVSGLDANGIARPLGTRCDLGALEFIPNVDTNNDGIVSPADVISVLNGLGSNAANLDIDGDGNVTGADADLVANFIGTTLD
ncbi:MAG: choice-of-anchor Q domain-containing protein [Chloroflexota bacterium]